MKRYIKHYLWFVKESYSFMKGYNRLWITYHAVTKAFSHARAMCKWDNATPQQRENWYISGEGRTMEF